MIPAKPLDPKVTNIKYRLGKYYVRMGLTPSLPSRLLCKLMNGSLGHHRGMMANELITVGSNSYEKVKAVKYLVSLLANQNSIHEEVKYRLNGGINTFKYHVSCTYGKISVRINLLFYLFFTVVSSNICVSFL